MTVSHRRLGSRGVGPIAIGGALLGLSPSISRTRAIGTIRAAISSGATLVDSALAYSPDGMSPGYCDTLIADAIAHWRGGRAALTVATKGGHFRAADGFPIDGRPQILRSHCEISLRAMRQEQIDLYQLHWPDTNVPIEESVGELALLREEGKIEMVGVCNVSPEQLQRSIRTTRIDSVQNPLSPFKPWDPVLELCLPHGIAFLAYSPLGGSDQAGEVGNVFSGFANVARRHACTPQQAVLAWLLKLSPVVIPISGATRPETAIQSVRAVDVELEEDDLAEIEAGLAAGAVA